MKKETKMGILKVADFALSLGIVAGGCIGFGFEAKKVKDASHRYINEYLNSNAVTEYIDQDLTNLNKLYDQGVIGQTEYTSKINRLKENAAAQIYSDNADFIKVKEDTYRLNFLGYIFVFSVGGALTACNCVLSSHKMNTIPFQYEIGKKIYKKPENPVTTEEPFEEFSERK